MDHQDSLLPDEGQPSTGEFYSAAPSYTRRDTISTVSSEKYPFLPAGTWTLSIHGNCTRCHHHHKATTIRIKLSDDPTEASHVHCERCGQKWLTIGGRNTTQLSLLSRTTDVDEDEKNFRGAVVGVVRSAASIALPSALPSVPEASSRQPSRGNSVRTPDHSPTQDNNEAAMEHGRLPGVNSPEEPFREATSVSAHALSHPRPRTTALSTKTRLTKKVLKTLKRKLKEKFPILKNVQLRKFLPSSKPKITTAVDGQHSKNTKQHTATSGLDADRPEQSTPDQDVSLMETQDVCTPSKSTQEAIENLKSFDREIIRSMSPEQRTAWVRDQITAFKCHCSRHCKCHHRQSTPSMVDSSTQICCGPSMSTDSFRRYSLEGLEGIGSLFPSYGRYECCPDSLPFHSGHTIRSTARSSESHTMVEGSTGMSDVDTVVDTYPPSSPGRSRVDFAQRPRQRSWSPRQAWSQHLRQPDLVPRDSMDSIIANSAARSSSRGGRRRPDRHSINSLAPPTIPPSRSNSPGVLTHGEPAFTEADPSSSAPEPSAASTPHLNGDVTDDENTRESDVTAPGAASRP